MVNFTEEFFFLPINFASEISVVLGFEPYWENAMNTTVGVNSSARTVIVRTSILEIANQNRCFHLLLYVMRPWAAQLTRVVLQKTYGIFLAYNHGSIRRAALWDRSLRDALEVRIDNRYSW